MRDAVAIGVAAALLCGCGSSSVHSTSATTSTGAGPTSTGATPGGGPGSGPPCGPRAAATLAAGSEARVYAVGGTVLGCARGSARAYRLGQRSTCMAGASRIAPVAVSGTLAGYGSERCGVDTGSSEVVVRRLSDGHTLATEPATTSRLGPESYVSVSALVLAPDGAAAWISVGGSIVGHRRLVEVHALDPRGERTLDAGSSIAPTVLRLEGATVRWRHGGVWRSARVG